MATGMHDHDDRARGEAARRGERAAFHELYRRHAAPAWRVGLAVSRDPSAAAAAVSAGFAAVLARQSAETSGRGVPLAVQLVAATRAAARDAVHLETVVRPTTGVLHLDATQTRRGFVSRGFETLPERWRTTLWLVDVEGWSVDDAAAVLDMAPSALVGLLDRARLGLREQVLVAGLRRPSPTDCRRATDCLTGYAAGTLTDREAAVVRGHLDRCEECRNRLGALDDLIPVLRSGAVVLPLSLAEQAAARWHSALVRPTSRLLTLPGGRTIPAWAERAFAGSVAAVVTLGIAAATMLATRDRGGSTIPGPPVAAAPAQDLSDTMGPDFFGEPSFNAGPTLGSAGGGATLGSGATPSRTSGALPRSQPVAGDSGPGVGPKPGSDLPPGSGPPPTTPPIDDSVVAAGIAGVGGVVVDEECAGGEVLGMGAGCAPPESSADPVSVDGTIIP